MKHEAYEEIISLVIQECQRILGELQESKYWRDQTPPKSALLKQYKDYSEKPLLYGTVLSTWEITLCRNRKFYIDSMPAHPRYEPYSGHFFNQAYMSFALNSEWTKIHLGYLLGVRHGIGWRYKTVGIDGNISIELEKSLWIS